MTSAYLQFDAFFKFEMLPKTTSTTGLPGLLMDHSGPIPVESVAGGFEAQLDLLILGKVLINQTGTLGWLSDQERTRRVAANPAPQDLYCPSITISRRHEQEEHRREVLAVLDAFDTA